MDRPSGSPIHPDTEPRVNSFLQRLAASPFAKEGGYRVHGVYLAWRGNAFPIANASRSGCWIIRCEEEIINGHNDVWSMQAMETYAALLRETEFLRRQKPRPPRSD